MKAVTLLKKHAASCVYREDSNDTDPWYYDVREHFGTSSYTLRGHTFVEMMCNDPDCKARVRVSTDYLTAAVPTFLPPATDTTDTGGEG